MVNLPVIWLSSVYWLCKKCSKYVFCELMFPGVLKVMRGPSIAFISIS